MIFSTNRLVVRQLTKLDIEGFHKLQSNPKVMQYTGTAPMSLEENKIDLNKVLNHYKDANNTFWVWAITTPNNIFIGTVAIYFNEQKEWEIGYRILEEHWGNGYGKEVTQGLIEHAFTKMNIKTLVGYVDKKNTSSIKILQHFFEFEKEYWNDKDQCWDLKFVVQNTKKC